MLIGENMKIDGPMQICEFKQRETNIKSKRKHTRLKLYSNLYEILKKFKLFLNLKYFLCPTTKTNSLEITKIHLMC